MSVVGERADRDLGAIRERLARHVSRRGFALGIPVIAWVLWTAPRGRFDIVVLALVAAVALGSAAYLPMPRRFVVPLTLSFLGVASIPSVEFFGIQPTASGGLAVICMLGACLTSPRTAKWIAGICVATIVSAGAYHMSGWIRPIDPALMDLQDLGNWERTTLTVSVVMCMGVAAIVGHLDDLRRTVRLRREQVDAAVDEERRRLETVEAHARANSERRRAQGLVTLGRLGGGFAHSCNNLLQAMSGELELLALSPEAQTADCLGVTLTDMIEAVNSAASVLRRLSTLSGNDTAVIRTPVNANEIVRIAVAQLARIKGLEVVTEARGSSSALADVASLHAVLLNLALNARDAMGGSGTLRIVVRDASPAERDEIGGAIAIEIVDTGTGMDEATLARLFEPLFTTKGTAGTGLGLSSSRRIIEAGGGTLRVASRLGNGTTFTILLPPSGEAASRPPAQVPMPAANPQGRWVLVVDDDASVRRAWRSALATHGFDVLEAADVDHALLLVREHSIALAWMDAVMPGRPTRELIAELRNAQPAARLVVCSGHVDEELLRRDVRTGDVEFVAKPCSIAVLIDYARRAVAGRQAERS
jgi:signal transduction histidine kinase/CheY-like chemotaxis protein